ncbi:YxlC family protein [Alicyclobacillus sp. SO9]|uniref:YxlC family protein n=1 Tax=Alicyclobacillus sp. SO9 TaxID=2665646 RepID=UPI0018E7CD01|nr:YxlC family protein [Alicyclobacillus sp. SO9]QQE76955.1 YxlC family protein [Alicyclobacillus sp. SO9]
MNRKLSQKTDSSKGDTSQMSDASQATDGSDEAFLEDLLEALKLVENASPRVAPALSQFQGLVQGVKKEERRRLVRDLVLFLTIALLIISGWVVSLVVRPYLFLAAVVVMSVCSLAAIPVVAVANRRFWEKSG